MLSHSPSRISTVFPSTVAVSMRCSTSMSRVSAPHTAGVPNWRATTAAWLVAPPRLVSIPLAANMPCTSSGRVSGRTMMTSLPSPAHRSAVSASNTARPTAAPGLALTALSTSRRPSPAASALASAPNCGWRSWSTCSGFTRMRACSRVMVPSLAMSTAILMAARAVRLPSRVCSIHRVPRSMVNSTSCMSV